MGVLRFSVYPPQLVEDRPELLSAYISGLDRMPIRTRVELSGGGLVCSRSVPESGVLNVPWRVDGLGQMMLRSATLRERPEPYHLQVELARGKVNQLRNHLADWEMLELELPDAARKEVRGVLQNLSRTLISQADPIHAAGQAEATLKQAIQTAERLTRLLSDRLFQLRHAQYPQLGTLLSCRVGKDATVVCNSPEFTSAFNAVAIQLNWRDIEPAEGEYHWEPFDALVNWCEQHHLVIKGGPLIQWSPNSLPAWLWLWEDDFDNLLHFVSDFVETVIARYRGRIRLWEVTARTNYGEILSLDEERRIRLTVRALRVAREMDPEAVYLVTVGQPWAEYMARREYQYAPIHFADALMRADLGLGALGLELAMGYVEDGSYCRDLLEISDLLDRYSMLGLPLHVALAAPSGTGSDDLASSGWSFGGGSWRGGWSEQTQADWIAEALPIVASKPLVQEIGWGHFSDAAHHEFPLAGLVRSDGTAKPALERVLQFRQEHLR
ncbi:MAG: endo-1,4-beta-xylanase [Planctomycetes bacterium]|nr:endo-1,4-beta-xylanase [Planctomycetota bacterium]